MAALPYPLLTAANSKAFTESARPPQQPLRFVPHILFKKIDVSPTTNVIHARDNAEGANIWILDNPRLPLILKMTDNPIEINWTLSFLFPSDAQNIGICQMNPTERELVK